MGCSSNARSCGPGTFALVSYIPGRLGEYLNLLRAELISGCRLQSHITLLPPRVLDSDPNELSSVLGSVLPSLSPFEVTLGEIEVFPVTDVVYVSVRAGWQELVHAHSLLADGLLGFKEPFPFHPHVTLAQGIPPDRVAETAETARLAWRRWRGERSFLVEHLAFVRNVDPNHWELLSEHRLSPVALQKTA